LPGCSGEGAAICPSAGLNPIHPSPGRDGDYEVSDYYNVHPRLGTLGEVIRYGEEIGMGDDLSLPDRESIRTPMQWSPLPNAGFSTAAAGQLVHPVVTDGTFGYEKVNVRAQRNDPGSLLSWFERMMRTLRECPEINTGTCTHVDVPTPPGLLVHRADDMSGTMLFLHKLQHLCSIDGALLACSRRARRP
jgi:glycosidase